MIGYHDVDLMGADIFFTAGFNRPVGIGPDVEGGPKAGVLLEDSSIGIPEESQEPNDRGTDK
jgi:hypothetical protein